ncbi:MAG: small ribosomal subunit biogenesis GTPase RsgA [Gammaproteobacteria bacterium]
MAKRRLTQRQLENQQKVQHARIERAKKREQSLDEQLTSHSLGPEQIGLLIAHYGANLVVEAEDGTLHHCAQRQNLGSIVTGDRIIWRAFPDGSGVIVARQPRTSELGRPDQNGLIRLMAANVDRIVIIVSPSPPPLATTIDRYLVAANWLNIEPILVLNKFDLIPSASASPLIELVNSYEKLGHQVVTVSTTSKQGLKNLQTHINHLTSVVVGQSGVGKSSLIAALIPNATIQIGAISEASGKGRHTTTTAMLYHLPEGGNIIDSPGIREFGLWHLTREVLEKGFTEFVPLIGQCKFRDCYHEKEPGCAIQAAVAEGHIAEWRLKHFHLLAKNLAG